MNPRDCSRALLLAACGIAFGWCVACIGARPALAAAPGREPEPAIAVAATGGDAPPPGSVPVCRDGLLVDPTFGIPIGLLCDDTMAGSVFAGIAQGVSSLAVTTGAQILAAGALAGAGQLPAPPTAPDTLLAAPAPAAAGPVVFPKTGSPRVPGRDMSALPLPLIAGLVLIAAGIALLRTGTARTPYNERIRLATRPVGKATFARAHARDAAVAAGILGIPQPLRARPAVLRRSRTDADGVAARVAHVVRRRGARGAPGTWDTLQVGPSPGGVWAASRARVAWVARLPVAVGSEHGRLAGGSAMSAFRSPRASPGSVVRLPAPYRCLAAA